MLRILATYGVHELCEIQPVLMKLRSAPSCIEYDTYYMSKGPMKIKPISATVIDSVWKDVYEGADFFEKGHANSLYRVDFLYLQKDPMFFL